MTEFQTIIYFLAVFGLTYLVRHTNGLGDCFLRLRCLLGQRHELEYTMSLDKDGIQDGRIRGRKELPIPEYAPWYTKMINCFWCLGTWIAGILYGLYFVIPFGFFIWLAAIGVSGVIYTCLQNGEKGSEV